LKEAATWGFACGV